MKYTACHFKVLSGSLDKKMAYEILVAELGQAGFESFTEEEDGLTAYIQATQWKEDLLSATHILSSDEVKFSVEIEEIKEVNWNREWEKNFDPIEIDGKVSIRAPFHDIEVLEYDILIEPKMSFGTGHHETTHLMIKHLLPMDLSGKSVLDMGCGTGVLAIFSELKGADFIEAIDIDPWCYENSLENVERNQCRHIQVFQGDASLLDSKKFDLIIANINRNILLQDMKHYAECLNKNGTLLLSGFYTEDVDMIDEKARSLGLNLKASQQRNNWVGLKYVN